MDSASAAHTRLQAGIAVLDQAMALQQQMASQLLASMPPTGGLEQAAAPPPSAVASGGDQAHISDAAMALLVAEETAAMADAIAEDLPTPPETL